MKNKEAAEDVLQDAYLKAFTNLKKLQEPEAFEKWLGVIVANTAKNALAKKNPVLFTDLTVNEDGEGLTYEVEDENLENQPETAYTREETRELVHELIDSLSEEQRMCIPMRRLPLRAPRRVKRRWKGKFCKPGKGRKAEQYSRKT